ncbi:MAG: hypothetical protein JNG84_10940 [Archangium sp.]|nr:hypothetical protein [Archangium sp.]
MLRGVWVMGVVALVACGPPPSQQESMPCSRDLGIDACGAGLVCAALDGRTVPTCYRERSRPDGSECTNAPQCASGACNASMSKCQASPMTTCDPAVGCAPNARGQQPVCKPPAPEQANICRLENLPMGSPCQFNSECASGRCGTLTGLTCV